MTYGPSLERAKAYLDCHLSGPAAGPTGVLPRPEGPFLTISREAGAGASSLAADLAERWNADGSGEVPWTVFDQDIVEKMLNDQHLSPRLARFLPEARVSEINASVGEIIGLHPNLWTLIQRTVELMRELARRGHVILVGRGANFATARVANGIHVRLIAPVEHRARYMAKLLDITRSAARARNKSLDAKRRDFVRAVFNADVTDPTAYDLLINTAKLPRADCVRALTSFLQTRSAVSASA